MRLLASLLAACAILAGCSGPTPSTGLDDATPTPGAPDPALNESLVPQRIARALEIDFDGTLSTFVHGCVFPAGQCPTTPAVGPADKSDFILEQPGTNLTAVAFNVTWDMTPATQTLAVGVMVMANCEGCVSTRFDEIVDNSPIEVNFSGLDLPLNESSVLHVYVYNPNFFEMLPGNAGYAFASLEQAFRIEGLATVSAPAK